MSYFVSLRSFLPLFIFVSLSGCLTTRSELKNTDISRSLPNAAQEQKAQTEARLDDHEIQFRELSGKIEVLENKFKQLQISTEKKEHNFTQEKESLDQKIKIFEDSLHLLDTNIQNLTVEIADLKTNLQNSLSANKNKNYLSSAEEAFNHKEWKKAIADYDNYRKANPKGKSVSLATLKMGLSFLELGMKDAAKFHFQEVVNQFPSSKEAKKAQSKLQSLK
ncbi:MAG: tetratricopeptide repeat protein [Bdellovibrionales bacterium]|nr:tetratricopeptide repeat protein [Bdellovibrionales bacterium]